MKISASAFNARYPVGTEVDYWSVLPARPGEEPRRTRTRSEAWKLGDHTPVVKVEGIAGGVSIAHLAPILAVNNDHKSTEGDESP